MNSSNKDRRILTTTSTVNREVERSKARDLIANIVLSRQEIAHLYQGGVLSVKIKGKEAGASVEISCGEAPEHKGTRIRFKIIEAE